MKRIHTGTATLGAIAVLFGLLWSGVVCYRLDSPSKSSPAAETSTVVPNASGQQEPRAAATENVPTLNAPTLAPPQETLAAEGPRYERRPRGQVVYIRVEASGIGDEWR